LSLLPIATRAALVDEATKAAQRKRRETVIQLQGAVSEAAPSVELDLQIWIKRHQSHLREGQAAVMVRQVIYDIQPWPGSQAPMSHTELSMRRQKMDDLSALRTAPSRLDEGRQESLSWLWLRARVTRKLNLVAPCGVDSASLVVY
jgi:hypothetical protein